MFDLAIIGAGINGSGIARDAAGRGLSVLLLEKDDLASGTSSASTKLIHSGLRYLEHYEFRVVRESLSEREVLWAMAPHAVRPMRFVLPHHGGLRPAWLIRLGLFLYDHIGGRRLLPSSAALDLAAHPAGRPLKAAFAKGFEYSDCWVDDARLVVLNAIDARERGADIRLRDALVSARRDGNHWRLASEAGEARARVLVNAAGPWVGEVLAQRLGGNRSNAARLVKGSHIVVRAVLPEGPSYIFQNADGRIVFAIPYEEDFTLIGTTDVEFEGDPGMAEITADEVAYLCRAVNEYLKAPVGPDDVVWSFAGVRPLHDDGGTSVQKATRDYPLEAERPALGATLLNVFGGKITTYRRFAEEAMEKLAPEFPAMGPAWTRAAALPGGDFPVTAFEAEVARLAAARPDLAAETTARLIRAYGTRAHHITDGLGEAIGADLHEGEAAYLVAEEWARTAEDVLWRRSKLGLRFTAQEVARLEAWLAANA